MMTLVTMSQGKGRHVPSIPIQMDINFPVRFTTCSNKGKVGKKWKFKMTFAMKGGGGSRLPLSHFVFFLKTSRITP